MKHIGLERDLNNEDIPENHSIDAKNGVNSKIRGASINEGGFKVHQKAETASSHKYGLNVTLGGVVYRRKPIGEVYIDDGSFLIMSLGYVATANINGLYSFSEIGLLKADGDYIALLNDLTNTEKLNFNPSFPYTGEFTRNYLNEVITTCTDDNNKPLYFNLSVLLNKVILAGSPIMSFIMNDYLMFPNISPINTQINIIDGGGNLENGIYYLSYLYENEDFSVTSSGLFDNPISIFSTLTGNSTGSLNKVKGDLDLETTSKAINVTLTGVNTNFKNLKVLALIKRKGIIYSKYITLVKITGSTINFIIDSSTQIGETISLQEALTPTIRFSKVYKFTQVYNRLYATRTTTNSLRNFQKYANLTKLNWTTKLISPLDGFSAARKEFNYDNKTFLHKEVYGFYVHLILLDGTVTEGFHIPYSTLSNSAIDSAGYRNNSTLAQNQGLPYNTPKFRIEDTCFRYTGDLSKGEFGFWENENEFYPNTDEWDSSGLTGVDGNLGQNFKNRKVTHHRFPSINWMKQFTYSSDDYGTKSLDQLGFSAVVTIPDDIKPFVKSWFISYAKRDYNNSTVIGQSILLYESTSFDADNSTFKTYPDVWSSGFNHSIGDSLRAATPSEKTVPDPKLIDKTLVRFYDLNLLKTTVDINPDYISNELMLRCKWDYTKLLNCNGTSNDGNNTASFLVNYINPDTTSFIPTSESTHDISYLGSSLDVRYRKINSYKYLNNNSIDGNNLNNALENTLLIDINSSSSNKYMPINKGTTTEYVADWFGGAWWNDVYPKTYLSNLMKLPLNVYNSLESQKLVNTGIYNDVNTTTVLNVYKGDGFTNYYSFHTGGWGGALSNKLYDNGHPDNGVKNLFIHVCETTTNLALRSSDNTSVNTKFYPESKTDYVYDINRDVLTVNTLYNSDYSSLNELGNLIPYQFSKVFVDIDYYKVNRAIAQQQESIDIGWRTWLANDYYIAPRNKGKVINIEGYDRSLIIHTENALMFTVGNEEMKIDASTAFVGSGNIFERPAYELAPSKEGSFGTKHRFSCLLTPYGYFSIDAERGIMFLLNKGDKGFGIDVISNNGLKRWLYDNLKIKTDLNVIPYGEIESVIIQDDNPYTGFGFTVGFDSEFNRLIISKKCYSMREEYKLLLETNDGGGNPYNNSFIRRNNRWYVKLPAPYLYQVETGFEDYGVFNNNSFTLSYDLDAKKFTFFHDYFPNKLFNNRNKIFCFKEKIGFEPQTDKNLFNRIFKLNQSNKGIYDNTTLVNIDSGTEEATPYPFYIVPIINHNKDSFKAVNLSWITRVFNNDGAVLPQETFTKVLAFTSYQSTPDTNIVIFNFNNYFEANTRNVKNEWFYNKLRDYLDENNYNSGEPIIKNYSELWATIDLNKSFEKIRPLEDKWLAVKFTYDNVNQNEIHILQISTIITPVNR